jgi:alpha-1,2-mannosyltransferase
MRDRAASSSTLLRIANALGVAVVAAELLRIAVRGVRLQWDFKIYLEAARAAARGLDPYRIESLVEVARRPVSLPFLYPPVALLPFLALASVPLPAALALWMALKVFLLAFLVILWKRVFVPGASWFTIALVSVFASNAAALWDLRSGNVALIEAALTWSGLACYVAGRRGAFAALVVLAALFKLAPAAFLLLLLVPTRGQPPRPKLFALALGALAALVFVPLVVGPGAHWSGFLGGLGGDFPVGEANPSLLALLVSVLRSPGGATLPPLALALWAACVVALLALSARGLRALWRDQDPCAWAIAAVALDLLVSPRPMAYGFVLGGGAVVALIRRVATGALARAGLVVIAVAQGVLWAFQQPWTGTIAAHAPFFVLLALWLLALVNPRPGRLQGAPA